MKHLAVALIVVSLMVADFMADVLDLAAKVQKSWAWWDTAGLIFAAWWLWHHRDPAGGDHD